MLLLGLVGAVALGLATVGVYGVLAYAVAQRTSEIGIRMALGAARGEEWRLVLWQGVRPALLGVAVGVIGAIWAARFLQALLFRVSPLDAVTFVAVPLLFVVIALVACAIPARRATHVDPATCLRRE
ncbi:MAG TPA: FtsX-like permease family protein [Vicinamibacterales bacterium]|nr:FtsX-like permease family protein [Vicinamibacterales bacterium]